MLFVEMGVPSAVLRSRRFNRWLPWLSAAILVAGIATFLGVYFGNTANSKETFSQQNAYVAPKHKKVPLSQAARDAAGKFILSAVQRTNAVQAYKLSGPSIRGDETLKQWLRDWKNPNVGVPIVPYTQQIWAAPMKIDYSYPKEAGLEVILVPKKGKKSYEFVMVLKKISGSWVVDYWGPRESPGAPTPS